MPINLTPEFESLYLKFHRELLNLSYNIVRNKDSAKDIVQEVFEKLWYNREKLVMGEQMKFYLFKATTHTSLTYLRNNRRIYRMDDVAGLGEIVTHSGSETIFFKEFELKSRQAIDRLPPRCKTIFLLSRQEGLTYKEIADTLGISLKAVENQMGIALQKLRQDLKPFLSLEALSIIMILGALLYIIFS